MNLEPVTQSEVNQEEKNKYWVLMDIYMEYRKMYWWDCLQGSSRDTGIENRLVDTVGEVQGGMNWESSIET